MNDRQTINADDLRALLQEEAKPKRAVAIADDQVSDYAVAALSVMRGLPRGDKLRVVRRMLRMLGSESSKRKPVGS